MKLVIDVPDGLHGDSVNLVKQVAEAMGDKLHRSQIKYKLVDGWKHPPKGYDGIQDGRVFHDREGCLKAIENHLGKGDAVNCINYLGFMLHFGWSCNPSETRISPHPYFQGFRIEVIEGIRYKRKMYQAGDEAVKHFDYLDYVTLTAVEEAYNKQVDLKLQEYLRNALDSYGKV